MFEKPPGQFDIHKVEEIYTRILSMLMSEGYTQSLSGFVYIFAANAMIGELIQRKLLDSEISLEQIEDLKKTAEKAGMDMIAKASGMYVTEKDGEA
jgi:hypothetical protein|tara:strand:- start:1388 stop:1675 length:288 start_codon:yes stop_codon:yes gene_type:complete